MPAQPARRPDDQGATRPHLRLVPAIPGDEELASDVRPVLRHPHPLLSLPAAVVSWHEAARAGEVAREMVATMRSHRRCTGIAAPQIGERMRIVAVDVSGHRKATTSHGLTVIVNPTIVRTEGAEKGREGCLSIPDLTADVVRPTRIVVVGRSLAWEPMCLELEGFEARCMAHEVDHLDGVVFLDRVRCRRTDVFERKT